MRLVYLAQNLPDAEFVRVILRDRGIETVLRNEYLQGALGELPLTLQPEVWIVHDADFELARRWVGEYEARRAAPVGPPWTCHHCGETNPGNFEGCWKCRRDRPSAAS